MEQLLELIKQQNPEAASYFEMMKPMLFREDEAAYTAPEVVEDVSAELEIQFKKIMEANQKLLGLVSFLQKSLKNELKRNDDLAKAIGACPECFGHDIHCPSCNGIGKPGHYPPDRYLFNTYIAPAINTQKLHFIN